MKHKKLKNHLKNGILLFGLLYSLQGCENEPVTVATNEWNLLQHGTNTFIVWDNINNFAEVKNYAIRLSRTKQNDLLRMENANRGFTVLDHIDAYI